MQQCCDKFLLASLLLLLLLLLTLLLPLALLLAPFLPATGPWFDPQEKFQPYFSDAGYDSWAVSLRGQGGSDRVTGASVAGTLDSHAQDLAEVVQEMAAAPVMVAHSFGGLIAQK